MQSTMNNKLSGLTKAGALALIVGGISAMSIANTNSASDQGADSIDFDTLPETIVLTGIVRDFQERSEENGHPDFQRRPSSGFGHYIGMVAEELSEDGKPVMASTGVKLTKHWKNAQGQNIMRPTSYISSWDGDTQGSVDTSRTGALTTEASFDQWFRSVQGKNLSQPLDLTLVRQAGSNVYTFDDKQDQQYLNTGGFFPINGELYGNFKDGRNYHFTTEINTEFTFHRETGQVFKFTGDDDVWVFINGQLVVDLGGLHPKREQFLDLDRLEWLQDGRTYTLDIFHAERRYSGSNFRIETTLQLRSIELPPTAALYD